MKSCKWCLEPLPECVCEDEDAKDYGSADLEERAYSEVGAIMAILEQWCYVSSYGQPFYGMLAKTRSYGPYTFDVIVKPDLSKVATSGTASAREYRAELMRRAEDTLDALEAAGWHLTEYPCMEFRGEVRRFAQFLGGGLAEPSRQGGIELRMRFAVDRPR